MTWIQEFSANSSFGTRAAFDAGRETRPRDAVDARLREFDVGPNRTGLTTDEYAAAFPDEYAAFRAGRYDVVPGGESTPQVVHRVTASLEANHGILLTPYDSSFQTAMEAKTRGAGTAIR